MHASVVLCRIREKFWVIRRDRRIIEEESRPLSRVWRSAGRTAFDAAMSTHYSSIGLEATSGLGAVFDEIARGEQYCSLGTHTHTRAHTHSLTVNLRARVLLAACDQWQRYSMAGRRL